MKAGLLLTGSGALIFLTSYESIKAPEIISKFNVKGISKFVVYEVPVDLAKKRYAGHYDIVMGDLHESDDLRILDYDGTRAFNMFSFEELGKPFTYDGK